MHQAYNLEINLKRIGLNKEQVVLIISSFTKFY